MGCALIIFKIIKRLKYVKFDKRIHVKTPTLEGRNRKIIKFLKLILNKQKKVFGGGHSHSISSGSFTNENTIILDRTKALPYLLRMPLDQKGLGQSFS